MKKPFGTSQKAQILNCETAQEQITLFVYEELSGNAADALERHLAACGDCRKELDAVREFVALMANFPAREPSPNLLTQSRIQLDEALNSMPPASWIQRLQGALRTNFGLLKGAPVAAAMLLFAGLGVGGYVGYQAKPNPSGPGQVRPQEPAPAIAAVNGITQQPAGRVMVSYDKLVPATAEGTPDDPMIRQLLAMGAGSRLDPAVRNNSVNLLADACRDGRLCADDADVRRALLVALRYDPNAEIRQKALSGLQPYVSEDMHVRDAVLEAVMDDHDPKVRSEAINMLQPVGTDSSVQQVLHTVAERDGNPQLRTESRAMLQQVSQIQ
jgi:hypothetical protein